MLSLTPILTTVLLLCVSYTALGQSHSSAPTTADTPTAAPTLPKSPIANAAEQRDWDSVSTQLQQPRTTPALLNAPQPDGMTALHWSVHHQNAKVVSDLLRAGADANAKNAYGVTPLSLAASTGTPETIAALLDAGAKVDGRQTGKVTPLMLAARNGNAQAIATLLDHGAKPDAGERRGQTPLMWAASMGNLEAVNTLLKAGADPNAANQVGFTAMMFAARDGRPQVVQRLLKAGVDPNATMQPKRSGKRVPRKGTSALTLAVESGHFELAMQLVHAGADPNDQRSGYTPLHAISWVRKPNWGEEPDGDPAPRGSGTLTSLEFVRALVDAGADVNTRLKKSKKGKGVLNTQGATPLLLAGKRADLPLIQLLVQLGADVSTTNDDGCTPLMAAAGIGVRAVGEEAGTESEVIDVIHYFVAKGLSVNTIDKNKETAMHGAAYRNFPAVVTCLAEHGADPQHWDHKNKYGWTPTMIGQGHRPGSFKPSPPTVAALEAAK